jgi:Tol biopolymer transport system component
MHSIRLVGVLGWWLVAILGTLACGEPSGLAPPRESSQASSAGMIAFIELHGDFFVDASRLGVVRPDSTPQLVTQGINWVAPVSWSPDGKLLAYESKGAIYTVKPDGSEKTRVVSGEMNARRPTWSPDGVLIAFTGSPENTPNLYVVNLDGGQPRTLTDNTDATGDEPYPVFSSVSWSGDARRIAVTRDDGEAVEILVLNLDGTTEAAIPGHDASLSPDGQRLAYFEGGNLYIAEWDGSNGSPVDSPASRIGRPVWSPDGTRLACCGGPAGLPPALLRIYNIDADGFGVTLEVEAPEVKGPPSWSPDGSELAFQGANGIYITRLDGSTTLLLQNDGNKGLRYVLPSWSPAR